MKCLVTFILVGILTSSLFFSCKANEERQKRWWLWYNGYADTILGFIFTVPFQAFLPGLGPKARALNLLEQSTVTEDLSNLDIQPQYEEEINKLLVIFANLGIQTLHCQERLVCLLSSDPEKFSPISELALREIGENYGPIIQSEKSLMWRYQKAYKTGIFSTLEQCQTTYSSCPVTHEDILNAPLLKAWQYFASKIRMRLL